MPKRTTRRAILHITPETLGERLSLPRDAEITGAGWDVLTRSVLLEIESLSLPEVHAGDVALRVRIETRLV